MKKNIFARSDKIIFYPISNRRTLNNRFRNPKISIIKNDDSFVAKHNANIPEARYIYFERPSDMNFHKQTINPMIKNDIMISFLENRLKYNNEGEMVSIIDASTMLNRLI